MPAVENDGRIHKAVYWEATGTNDEMGRPLRLPGVEIDVRWIIKRRESVDSNGNPVAIEAIVLPDFLIPLNSLLWRGTLAEWNAEHGSDNDMSEVMLVMSNGAVDDIDGKETKYRANLSFYRSTRPE